MNRLLCLGSFWIVCTATALSSGILAVGLVKATAATSRYFTLIIPGTRMGVTFDIYFCAVLVLLLAALAYVLKELAAHFKPALLAADRRDPEL